MKGTRERLKARKVSQIYMIVTMIRRKERMKGFKKTQSKKGKTCPGAAPLAVVECLVCGVSLIVTLL